MRDDPDLQQLLDAIASAIRDGVVFVDGRGVALAGNQAAADVLGRGAPGVSGSRLLDLLAPFVTPDGRPATEDGGRIVTALQGLDGAQDVRLLDPLRGAPPTEVLCSVSPPLPGGLRVVALRDLSDATGYDEQLRHRALHDPFTGLPNRLLLIELLDHALEQASRRSGTVAVVSCDIDGLKVVNDSLGYTAGDAVLMVVAHRLVETAGIGEAVARVGGDEFVVFCEDVNGEEHAIAVAERVRKTLAEPIRLGGREVSLTASMGVALSAHEADDAEGLLRDAAAAMHSAKTRGDTYEVFGQAIRDSVVTLLEVRSDLPGAIERGELQVHYQPKVRLADDSVAGHEALVRWIHPAKGMIQPSSFIPIAEQTGLIVPVDVWVLRAACAGAAAPTDQHGRPTTISVNLSARQLVRPGLADLVRVALDEAGVEPGRLILEITETALMVDEDASISALWSLADAGVGLAIDDFGKGYSSLSYVRRFPPIAMLKIDSSFIADLGPRGGDPTIVRAMVSLAHGLGAEALAEGIESPEQAEILRSLGCDLGQGFYFGEPRPRGDDGRLPGRG